MLRRVQGLAAALTTFATVGACAQTSVTLFGIIDGGVGQFKGAATGVNAANVKDWRFDSIMSTSRFGFSGAEDLGSGLSATFELSSFFRNNTGAAGRSDAIGPPVNVAADPFFSRSSWVGLTSRDFGRLRLGNFATPLWVASINSNPFGDSTVVSPINLTMFIGSPLTGGTGWTNQIAYDSPSLAGYSLATAVSASEGQGGRNSGLRLGYAVGSLAGSLAYQTVKKNPLTFADGTSPNNTKSWLLSGSFDFGVAKVFAHAGNIHNEGTEAAPLNVRYKVWDLGATVPLGPGNVLAGFAQRKTNDAAGAVPATAAGGNVQRKVFTVGYDYLVSKRTDLYAIVMSDRTVTNTLPAPQRLVDASATNLALGVRHRF